MQRPRLSLSPNLMAVEWSDDICSWFATPLVAPNILVEEGPRPHVQFLCVIKVATKSNSSVFQLLKPLCDTGRVMIHSRGSISNIQNPLITIYLMGTRELAYFRYIVLRQIIYLITCSEIK